jgi:hypothetical protein
MVKECSNKYDSENRIYTEYMDEDSMNDTKYVYSLNEESEYSNGMWSNNIKIRCND